MKLASFGCDRRLGVVEVVEGKERIVPLDDLLLDFPLDEVRRDQFLDRGIALANGGIAQWLQLTVASRAAFENAVRDRLNSAPAGLDLDTAILRAPVARPGKVVGVGRNYADHARETGVKPFEQPRIIFKMPSSIADPGSTMVKPSLVKKLDFEAELAVVIGDFAKDVSQEEALDYVAGYTALNDLSAREFQFDINPAQTTFAKSSDGFCPLGPYLVTCGAFPDPQTVRVTSTVNGQRMQDASTADMLFSVRQLIAYVSQYMTLEPSDVIATGTPAGIGAARNPPQWLRAGDLVEVEVSGVGRLVTYIG